MVTKSGTYRQGIIEALRLARSAQAQKDYAKRVPIADIVAEVFECWWDLYHPKSPEFQHAFTEPERKALAAYESECARIAAVTPRLDLENFQAMPQCRQLADAASRALVALGDIGDDTV